MKIATKYRLMCYPAIIIFLPLYLIAWLLCDIGDLIADKAEKFKDWVEDTLDNYKLWCMMKSKMVIINEKGKKDYNPEYLEQTHKPLNP